MSGPVATVLVCTDCLMVHANGETEGPTDREPWSLMPGADVALMCDDDDGDNCIPFSSRDCDACGTALAGARHRMAVFAW